MKYAITIVFICAAFALVAQPGNPNTPAPLDGGVSMLLIAGAGFGAKKLYDLKRVKRFK